VEIADEFQEVRLLLHDDGFVPVLEEVPHPLVAAVVPEGIAREQPAHELREPLGPTAQQQVGVVREEGPGVERRPGGRGEVAQSRHERLAVLCIGHDVPAFQPPEDHVVHRAGGIEPRLAG